MSIVRAAIEIPVVKNLLWAAIVVTTVGWSVVSRADNLSLEPEVLVVREDRSEIDLLVQQVHQGINKYRIERDLLPLNLNSKISQQAEIHSQDMAQQIVKFSHQGFESRIGALDGHITYRRAAENLAYNQGYQDPVQKAIAGWIKSEGHHKNMIGDFNLTGIGVAKNKQGEYYFTQIFIKEN